jgi:hypothetical protein
MTGERALIAVISIFWIAAALVAIPGALQFASAIATGENYLDLWGRLIRVILQTLWFAGPAFFLARGSRVARWFAIFASLSLLAAALVFAVGLMNGGVREFWPYLLVAPFVWVFLFSTWALLFYRGLREALAQRLEKWKAAEKARLQQLYDAPGEGSEK